MKRELHRLLEEQHFDGIAEMAGRRKRVLGSLVSLTFDPEPLIAWRAVEAMGAAAERIARDDPQFVRNHLRRLYWLISEESGGVCWRAPEAMAEITRRRPELCADYVPIIVSLLASMAEEDLSHFRAGILWAIGRLGTLAREHAANVLPAIAAVLDHPASQVRGMAAWCLQETGQTQLLASRADLLADRGSVDLYQNGQLVRTSVADLIRQI